jgi:hypothetical protein
VFSRADRSATIVGMSRLNELRSAIRDFVQHPRRRDALASNTPEWNAIASAFDTIADTDTVIATYKAMPARRHDTGRLYLMIYGLLQALYVQEDAVESLVRGFSPSANPKYKIENEPEAARIRVARNKAIGHPTRHGDANSNNTPGVQTSYHISQFSMSKRGFDLMTSYADGSHTFEYINLSDLIESNAGMLERVLTKLIADLETTEMEHRKQFRDDKLFSIFPTTLDYYFEKIYVGARKQVGDDAILAKGVLEIIAAAVFKFRAALTQRGLLRGLATTNTI